MTRTGVLLIHGFTGHRSSLEALIPELERRGVTWEYPILTGHGTTPNDLSGARWSDWRRDVEQGLDILLERTDQVVIIALSMGAVLALEVTAERQHQVAGAVLLSPCVMFRHPLAKYTPLLAPLIRRMPFSPKEKFSTAEYAKQDRGYRWFPTQAYYSYWRRTQTIFDVAANILCPVKIIQSTNDRVADPRGAQRLFEALRCPKEVEWITHSGHEVLLDQEAEHVIHSVMSFTPLHSVDEI